MRFKLDEKLGRTAQALFREAGHDVSTVRDDGLLGASDTRIRDAAIREHRCLVTFDMDFSEVLRFPPREAPGTIIIRLSVEPTLPLIQVLVQQVLDLLEREPVEGRLWIVEPGRIRIHEADEGSPGTQGEDSPE